MRFKNFILIIYTAGYVKTGGDPPSSHAMFHGMWMKGQGSVGSISLSLQFLEWGGATTGLPLQHHHHGIYIFMTQLWRRLGDKVIGKPHLSDIMWAWCILRGILSLKDYLATPSTTPPFLPVVIGIGIEGEVFKDGYS